MGRLKAMPSRLSVVPARLNAAPQDERERSRQRDQMQAWRAWYKTPRWKKLRRKVLARDGYVCALTGTMLVGKYPAPNSAVVDHICPHRGDPDLFWDETNLQALCKGAHDGEKQKQEARDRYRS